MYPGTDSTSSICFPTSILYLSLKAPGGLLETIIHFRCHTTYLNVSGEGAEDLRLCPMTVFYQEDVEEELAS